MINPASVAALTEQLYPDGTQTDIDFDLEWLNAYHSMAEETAIMGHVSSRYPDRPTGFEIAVMDKELRTQLSHLKLPSKEAEIEAFNGYMKVLEVPAQFGTSWDELKPHLQSYREHAWYPKFGEYRQAYTSDGGLFVTWRFDAEGLHSLEICYVDTVRKLQLDPHDPDSASQEPPYPTFVEFTHFMSSNQGPFEASSTL